MRVTLFVLLALSVLGARAGAVVTSKPVEKDGLRLTISSVQPVVPPWCMPAITWTFTNTSGETLLIDPQEMRLTVTGAGAKYIAAFTLSICPLPNRPLLPGQDALFTHQRLSDKRGEWQLEPGTYTVKGEYAVSQDRLLLTEMPVTLPPPTKSMVALTPGGKAWTGTLVSGELTLTILPPNPMYTQITDIYRQTQNMSQIPERDRALRALPPEADTVLVQMLHDGNSSAIEAVGLRRVREAVPDLLAYAPVDERAIVALGQIGDVRAVRVIERLLPEHRHAALGALASIRDQVNTTTILPFLKYDEDQTAAEAMAALQYISGEPWSVRLLNAYLQPEVPNAYPVETKNPSTRLWLMGDVAVDAVWNAYQAMETPEQRKKVGVLLYSFLTRNIRTSEIVAWLLSREAKADPSERLQLCYSLQNQNRDDVLQFLIRMTKDADQKVSQVAQEILERKQR